MVSNDSNKTTSLPNAEQKHSLTPRPIPQAKPANQPAKDNSSKKGKK